MNKKGFVPIFILIVGALAIYTAFEIHQDLKKDCQEQVK